MNKGISLLVFYAGMGLIYNNLLLLKSEMPALILIILSAFLPALLTGQLFHELTVKTDEISASSSVYSADLAGSAFGFILLSGVAIPAFGIRASIFLLSSLIFAGLLFGSIRNKL